MKNSSSFQKLSRHLHLSYPLLDQYNSVSGQILNSSQKDYFVISLLFGYLQEIFRKQALNQLRSFIAVFEHDFLPFFNKYEHNYKKSLIESSLIFLKKIEKFSKFEPEEAIQKLESIKGKPKELAFIVKVALFNFLYKLRKIETDKTDKKIKKNLKKKQKFLLNKKEELRDSKTNKFFFSSVFKVNLLFFPEKHLKNAPERYFFDKKNTEILKVAFFQDKDKTMRILSKEDFTYQDDKEKLLIAQRDNLLLKEELLKFKQNSIKSQIKHNNLVKAYIKARKIPELLLESYNKFTEDVILSKEYPEKNLKYKFLNYSLLISALKNVRKYENLAKIQKNNDTDNIKRIQRSIKEISEKINGISELEDEISNENNSEMAISEVQSLDQDHEDSLELNHLENSNKLQEIQDSLQINFLKIQHKKEMKNFDEESKGNIEKIKETLTENIDDIIGDEEIKPKFECPICYEEVPLDQALSLGCSHRACQECLTKHLLVRYDNGQWGFDIQCFSCDMVMNSSNSIQVLIKLIGREKVEKMSEKAAFDLITNQCAGCQYPFILQEDNQIQNFICDICKAETCLKCGELKHEEKFCKKILKEMQIALNDDRMRCCPNCMEIYLKDNHCEHVTCFKCKLDFCYNCSAPREPILGHGGQFHRRGCKYFFRLMDVKTKTEVLEDEYCEKCKDCKKNEKVCHRPEKDLKTFYTALGLNLENEMNVNDAD